MKRQNMGDSIGETDSNGIAEWYPNCKVRFDGSHYIATPHTTNPARRRKRKEEIIIVSEQNGKLKIEKQSHRVQNELSEPLRLLLKKLLRCKKKARLTTQTSLKQI